MKPSNHDGYCTCNSRYNQQHTSPHNTKPLNHGGHHVILETTNSARSNNDSLHIILELTNGAQVHTALKHRTMMGYYCTCIFREDHITVGI